MLRLGELLLSLMKKWLNLCMKQREPFSGLKFKICPLSFSETHFLFLPEFNFDKNALFCHFFQCFPLFFPNYLVSGQIMSFSIVLVIFETLVVFYMEMFVSPSFCPYPPPSFLSLFTPPTFIPLFHSPPFFFLQS